jgi:hypothetical protein
MAVLVVVVVLTQHRQVSQGFQVKGMTVAQAQVQVWVVAAVVVVVPVRQARTPPQEARQAVLAVREHRSARSRAARTPTSRVLAVVVAARRAAQAVHRSAAQELMLVRQVRRQPTRVRAAAVRLGTVRPSELQVQAAQASCWSGSRWRE